MKTLSQALENLSQQSSPVTTAEITPSNSPKGGLTIPDGVMNTLREIADSQRKGHLINDKSLETLLRQYFGRARIEIKPKWSRFYDEQGGYDETISGYELSLDKLDDGEIKLYDAMKFFNAPSTPEFMARKILQLRSVMARAAESSNDITIVAETYSEHLEKYPPDVVAYVIDKTIATKKWFPLVCDLRKEMDEMMRFRRSILELFERKRNPLLSKTETKQIKSDPRTEMHWKTLQKKDWLDCHWEWAAEEADKMLALAKENPTILDLPYWENQVLIIKNRAVT